MRIAKLHCLTDVCRCPRAACKAAGIVNLRWHDLRHEHASRLVEKGVPLSQVRDLLGHASIVTTERYDNQNSEALMAGRQAAGDWRDFQRSLKFRH
jgi:site-specific recombinase XerD